MAPQEALAATMRDKMAQKPEPQEEGEQEETIPLAWGVGFGIAVIAGIALTIGYKNTSNFKKARYKYKAKSLGNSVTDALSSVVDTVLHTVVDTYKTTKDKAGKMAHQAKAEAEEEVVA